MGSFFKIFKTPNRKKPNILPPDIIDPGVNITFRDIRRITRDEHKVNPIGMSYWRNINQHRGDSILQVCLSISDELTIFSLNKATLEVLSERRLGIRHTGESIFFSSFQSGILYVPVDNVLFKVNIFTGEQTPVWSSSHILWQVHSDAAEQRFSATLKDNNYNPVAWGISDHAPITIKGHPDECQIDKLGEWITIKEDNYLRIIHISSGDERIVSNEDGAVGHSDVGYGVILGENDFSPHPGALESIDLRTGEKKFQFSTGIWNMGYVSFTNARNAPLDQQYCLVTTPQELISVKLDSSGIGKVVCPNLTESQDYENRPKANLCPNGEYAIFTSFVGGRLDAYITGVPKW